MARLTWDALGERLYETGTSHGVLFPIDAKGIYENGVAWNGLVSVKQSPDGAEESPIYANDHKYLSITSAENFKGSIEAFTYPDEFMACDGSKELNPGVYAGQQTRKPFGLVYSTIIGNDTEGNDHGEKIHVIYNAKVAPSSRDYTTVNEQTEPLNFSWEFTTTPADVSEKLREMGIKPTAYIGIDCTKLTPEQIKTLKDTLYGAEAEEAKMPTIDELIELTKPAVTEPEG